MQQIINLIIDHISEIIQSNNIFIGMLIIVLESMLPILPLAVFITLNMIVFGNIVGFTISWIATVIGCILSFAIVRKYFYNYFNKKYNDKRVQKIVNNINKIPLPTFILIIALPYTPAFIINIAAGLSKMMYKKFIIAIIISKTFIVYFWGFVGTTLVQSISNTKVVIEIIILLLLLYLISKIIAKKFNLN